MTNFVSDILLVAVSELVHKNSQCNASEKFQLLLLSRWPDRITRPPGKVSNIIIEKYINDSAIATCLSTANNVSNVTSVASLIPSPPIEIGRLVVTNTIGTIEK